MRDLDQGFHALLHRKPTQLGTAILGHNRIHILAGNCHACAWSQGWHNRRNGAILSRRAQGNDSLSALRHLRPPVSVKLTASTAELARPDALGTNLPKHIHLDGCINADHLVVLRDNIRVIHITTP